MKTTLQLTSEEQPYLHDISIADRLISLQYQANQEGNEALAFCCLVLRNHTINGTINNLADVLGKISNVDWRIFISRVEQ